MARAINVALTADGTSSSLENISAAADHPLPLATGSITGRTRGLVPPKQWPSRPRCSPNGPAVMSWYRFNFFCRFNFFYGHFWKSLIIPSIHRSFVYDFFIAKVSIFPTIQWSHLTIATSAWTLHQFFLCGKVFHCYATRSEVSNTKITGFLTSDLLTDVSKK